MHYNYVCYETGCPRPCPTRHARLTQLADFLERPLPGPFDMGTWGIHEGDHPPEEQDYCGTTACVLGWAATIREFRAAGLFMHWMRDASGLVVGRTLHFAEVRYGGRAGVPAGAYFFHLTEDEADDVFLGTHRELPQIVVLLRALAECTPPEPPDMAVAPW